MRRWASGSISPTPAVKAASPCRAVDDRPAVDRDDVALLEDDLGRRHAVDDDVVGAAARIDAGERRVAVAQGKLDRAPRRSMTSRPIWSSSAVVTPGRFALRISRVHLGDGPAGLAHLLQRLRRLADPDIGRLEHARHATAAPRRRPRSAVTQPPGASSAVRRPPMRRVRLTPARIRPRVTSSGWPRPSMAASRSSPWYQAISGSGLLGVEASSRWRMASSVSSSRWTTSPPRTGRRD